MYPENHPESRLAALGLALSPPHSGVGMYVSWARTGNVVTTSFQFPWREGQLAYTGRVGHEVSTEQAFDAARLAALSGLAQLKEAAGGDLAKVRLVRLDGHVGCSMDFKGIPHVLNGASELLTQVLGEPHCRTALGHMVMPLDSPVMLGFLAEINETPGAERLNPQG
jgi:enamine deaminase RidA (YjgF/YER057c/UK114 family)